MQASTRSAVPGEPPPRRMLAGGAIAMATSVAVGLAALGLASIVVGRALGLDDYGTFAVALSVQALLIGLSSIGLENGIAYEVATGHWRPASALRHAVVASILLGLVGSGAGAVALVFLHDSVLPGASTIAIVALLIGIPAGVVVLVLAGVATALERYEAAALMQAGPPLGIATLASLTAVLFGLSATIAAIGAALVLAGLPSARWALRLAPTLGSEPDSASSVGRLRAASRFGAKTWGVNLLNFLNLRVDLILVAALAGSEQAGLYAVPAMLTSLGLVAPEALGRVLLPRIGSLDKDISEGEEGAVTTIGRAGRQSVLLAAATAVALVAAMLLIPVVYGSEFEGSVELGLVLVPGIAALGVSGVASSLLAGLGRPDAVLRIFLAVVPLSVVAFALVIPSAEALGAAVVSTISYVLMLLLTTVALTRRSRVSPSYLLVPRAADMSVYPQTIRALRAYAGSFKQRRQSS